MKIKFKNRQFDLMEKLTLDDGTIELWLRGTRAAEYKATLTPNAPYWQLVYNSAFGKRAVLRFNRGDYKEIA